MSSANRLRPLARGRPYLISRSAGRGGEGEVSWFPLTKAKILPEKLFVFQLLRARAPLFFVDFEEVRFFRAGSEAVRYFRRGNKSVRFFGWRKKSVKFFGR